MRAIWRLPGPSTFVSDLADDLRSGQSIVLLLPEHGPQEHGLRQAIAEEWQNDGGRRLEVIWADGTTTPERYLAQHCGLPPGIRLSPGSLAAEEKFRGRLLWIEGLCQDTWPRWETFLREYQHAARSHPAHSRTLFVALLVGRMAEHGTTRDIALEVHRWDDVLDSLDLSLHAAHLLRERSFASGLRPLLAATITRVALFDLSLAERLAYETAERILAPTPVLLETARNRGWSRDLPASWAQGTAGSLDGTQHTHSALEVLSGGVEDRLWRAQVGAIFPRIEEFRQDLVKRLRRLLRVPFETEFGVVKDIHDLEISHLQAQVRRFGIPISDYEREALSRMVKVRNALAHLEAIEPDMVLKVLQ